MKPRHCLLLLVSFLGCKRTPDVTASSSTTESPPESAPADAGTAAQAATPDAAPPLAAPAATSVRLRGDAPADVAEKDKIACSGSLSDGSYRVTDKGVPVHLVGPDGTTVIVQGQTFVLGKGSADAYIQLLGPTLKNGGGEYGGLNDSVTVPVAIANPDGTSSSGTLDCSSAPVVGRALLRIKKGPVRWPVEGEQRYKKDALAAVSNDGSVALYGDYDVKLYDVDFIAMAHEVRHKYPDCRYQIVNQDTGASTGERVNKERVAIDLAIDVYDRRTGKKVKTKTLKADKPTCPEWIPVDAGVSTFYDGGNIEGFYASILTPGGDGPEYAPPSQDVAQAAAPVEETGVGLPKRKLPAVKDVDKTFMALGYKVDSPFRDYGGNYSDGTQTFSASGQDGDKYFNVQAADWSGAAKADPPSAFVVGPRFALRVQGDTIDVSNAVLAMLRARPLEKAQDIVDVVSGMGFAVDGDVPKPEDDLPVKQWLITLKGTQGSLLIDFLDWGAVADGKATNYAVARSDKAFVIVNASVEPPDPGLAAAVLAKLVK